MSRPASGALSASKSNVTDNIPLIPVKEETRDLVETEPRYNDGVLEGMWRDRRIEKTKPCRGCFRGESIYTTSYQRHDEKAYLGDDRAWENMHNSEAVHPSILMEASGPQCRENFTTTTDLMHHWMPQVCGQPRSFNTRHLEWLPAQDLLPCLGNLTQYGLKEAKAEHWALERAHLRSKPVTTHRAHYHVPCASHRETSRRAVCRLLSSKLLANNNVLNDQQFRGQRILISPSVLQGQYPIDICRERLPIVPELPLEPAPALRVPDRGAGPHPFPECCTGLRRCRRVPGGTAVTTPALPFYVTSCSVTPPTDLI